MAPGGIIMDELSTSLNSDRNAGPDLHRTVTSSHLCWAEIDLGAVAHNVRTIHSTLSPNVELLAVVKANAYGLGAVPISRTVLSAGATRLGVANLDEAAELRQAGIEAPILVLGYIPNSEAERVLDLRVVPTVASAGLAHALDRLCRRRQTQIPVHIKVDSGMGRFGLLPGEVEPLLRSLGTSSNLRFEGIYSHFATADSPDKSTAHQQLQRFTALLDALRASGFEFPCVHMANSAATLALPQAHFDMVRCGLALLGHYPGESCNQRAPLRPALTLKSRIARVRKLPAGSGVGYGHVFTTTRPTDIALAPIGYAEGVRRAVTGRGRVLIRGRRAPLVGRVSMGYVTVNANGIGAEVDDEVVLIGLQGSEEISAEEVAVWSDTIVYEVFTGLSERLPRIYLGSESRRDS